MSVTPAEPLPPEPPPSRGPALAAALAYLLLWLTLAPDYGPTWDAVRTEHPYGEAFLACLVHGNPDYISLRFDPGLEPRQPHPDFSLGRLPWYAAWPLTSLVGAAACQVLWTGLGWMPPLVAHHLGLGLLVALLVYVVFRQAERRFDRTTALLAVIFLVATPRFFAHSFNNLKDLPEACLYNLAYLAGVAAWCSRRTRDALGFGALLALALAQRPNALFLGPQLGLLLVGLAWLARRRGTPLRPPPVKAFVLALLAVPVVYFLVTPALWVDPFGRLAEQGHFTFLRSTNLREAEGPLGLGRVDRHALATFVLGTPLSLLLLAGLGLTDGARAPGVRLFLGLGVLVPIGRTLVPGMRDYDGLRHFLEFHPPLAVLAGLGAARTIRAARQVATARGRRVVLACAAVLLPAPTVLATVGLHPNSLCFYNRLVGGMAGARAKGLVDATDYWANSYWQGLSWLEEHAEPEARLLVPVAEHVARCAAPLRLSRELLLPRDPVEAAPPVLYVMSIHRETADAASILRYLETREPVHEIVCQGAPILSIHRLEGAEAREVHDMWSAGREARSRGLAILEWLKGERELLLRVRDVRRREGLRAALTELSRHLPEELVEEAEEYVRLRFGEEPEEAPPDR